MSFKQKTWKDRISEHPARRTLTDVSNNTTKTVDVAREEGTISQEGDAYSAANMNDLEQRVADGFSTLSQDSVKIATKNTTSDSIAFGIDSNGNYGYIKEGADTVTPFKSQKDIDNAYNSGVAAADARVNTSSASYNSGYANGVSSGKGTNATVTILGAAGGHGAVYFAINLTVNSNGTVHVNSISRTGSAGSPYDFGDIRMGLTITGTDGSSVIARD